MRISVRRQTIKDIQDFNRLPHVFNMLENAQTCLNDMCEGFVYFDDINNLDDIRESPGIKAGSYQTVIVEPLCGLFNQATYLPLRYMPIELELELADHYEPSITNFNVYYNPANTSVSWRIQHCQINCDIFSFYKS